MVGLVLDLEMRVVSKSFFIRKSPRFLLENEQQKQKQPIISLS
jgi:hypothetical protein